MPRLKKPSLKQKIFAKRYVENGGNATEAALAAYNADYNNAQVIGAVNLDKPLVIQEIDKILKATGMSTDSWIADKLKYAIDQGIGIKATNKDALHALDMLLKVNSSYPVKKSMSVKVSMRRETASKDISEIRGTMEKLISSTQALLASLK